MGQRRQFGSIEEVKKHFSDEFVRKNPEFAQRVQVGTKDVPESYIQQECERILEEQGYRRRSQARILRGRPDAGWYIHIQQAAGNPIVLDLLILGNDGSWIEIELKNRKGRPNQHQKALIEHNEQCVVAYGVAEFRELLIAWENRKRDENERVSDS